ncbi:GNAT family protein [Congregibacter brevis]|uniref:GNAT family protein n=1 Tax=Congregibacter brevis TaxID=3081201 RepID=A0ABZ0I9Y0_9GAMM|nr:GNAT family protein [Congregibacter sp. IMCC45268]
MLSEHRRIDVDAELRLEALELGHAPAIFDCVGQNREHLRRWLLWVDKTESQSDIEIFLSSEVEKWLDGTAAGYAIFCNTQLCGVAGFNQLDRNNAVGEIGYWLAESYTGQGIMTCVANTLCDYGFKQLGLKRIEIRCATGNNASRRVAERVGSELERIEEAAVVLNGEYVDHAVYALER